MLVDALLNYIHDSISVCTVATPKDMPTTKKRLAYLPEGNEEELLKDLAELKGVSMSRMIGILIREEHARKVRHAQRIIDAAKKHKKGDSVQVT